MSKIQYSWFRGTNNLELSKFIAEVQNKAKNYEMVFIQADQVRS